MVQVLVDHRRVICSKTVFLQLWLDHVDARRKSFQVYVNLYLQELSSMPSTAHSRFSSLAWVRLRSLLSKGSVPAFPRIWAKHVRTQSAWRLQVVDVRPSPADSWLHDICSDCFLPASRGPGLSWDSRRALHKSPPNEFDCHDPSSRGSLRPCISMYSTLACPRHTYRRHPSHQWSSCFVSSTTRSCMDSSRAVWQLYLN